jgi:serine/threonine-protein kinase RsbW
MLSIRQQRTHDAINVCISLSSSIDDAEKLTSYFLTLGEGLNLNKAQFFKMGVCLGEAINNIIEHAYTKNTPQSVRAFICINKYQITIRLMDAGISYRPPEKVPPKLEDENGRGWYILRNWTDQINYLRQGRINRLVLIFRLDSSAF